MNYCPLYKEAFSYLLFVERDLEINFPSILIYFYYLKISKLVEIYRDDY